MKKIIIGLFSGLVISGLLFIALLLYNNIVIKPIIIGLTIITVINTIILIFVLTTKKYGFRYPWEKQ